MAVKPKKGFSGSIDDILGELLGSDDETPAKPTRASQPARSSSRRAQSTSVQASKKSFLEDDFFSRLPAEDTRDAEGSSASDADAQDLVQTLKDMDEMEADLLGISKRSSGPRKTSVKGPEKPDCSGGAGKPLASEKGEPVPVREDKPLSPPAASQQYKKFNFEELLSDEEQDAPKKPTTTGAKSSSERKTEQSKKKEPPQTPLHAVAPVRRRQELVFGDDGDDLMDALGLGSGPKRDGKQGKKAEEEQLRPACSKLDELLGQGSVTKALEQLGMGEHKEVQLDKKYERQPEEKEGCEEEDFVFGEYQPTVASALKDQPVRRPSVRFSAENSSDVKPEPCFKLPPAVSRSAVRGSRSGGDWLGLKDEDFLDSEPPSPVKTSPAMSHPSPATQHGPTRHLPAAELAAAKAGLAEEEDWLMAALSRKKAQVQAKAQERSAEPSEAPGKDPHSPVRQPATSTGSVQQAAAPQEKAASASSSRQPVPWLSTPRPAPACLQEAANGSPSRHAGAPVSTASIPAEQEVQGPVALTQVGLLHLCLQEVQDQGGDCEPFPDDSPATLPAPTAGGRVTTPQAQLPSAPQPQAEFPALRGRRLGAPAAQPYEDASACQAALLSTQARVAELESQVRTLELERTQHRLLLDSLQQRHQEDLDLLESAHRSRMKVVEETYRQRDERLRQEKEQITAQLESQSRDAEQARAELLAQHQQRLATLERQSALELERLRELQRTSVQEMRKDHEEQLQRLKRLKDQEIDAVTSATSHTRSLNGIIEQMEKFSSDLHNLSHKVEAAHHSTSQELAMGAWQRDQQLKVLQDRLSQQQKDVEEERSRLQEVIAKMEARLGEQTRLLEQERWRATAEQSKVESLQHSLEEQRRIMTQQLSMERAELERAKSALLQEQKSVMQKCSEERRKLAAEWAEFHTQQQLSKERVEREMERALQMDCRREGTIVSLAKEQADLKIWSRELKAKEEQLAKDRELLDEAWQELRLEKEKVNKAALHIQQREEEIKNTTKLSSQKYEDGERALREACRVQAEQQSRLQVMQQHLEKLKQQEQHLHQERLSMACQRRQLERLREELPSNPTVLLTGEQGLGARRRGHSTLFPLMATAQHSQGLVPGFPPPIGVLTRHSLGDSRETLAEAGSAELYTKLLLLKHRAQQDHSFLEDEQFFLETLKKAPFSTSLRSH